MRLGVARDGGQAQQILVAVGNDHDGRIPAQPEEGQLPLEVGQGDVRELQQLAHAVQEIQEAVHHRHMELTADPSR